MVKLPILATSWLHTLVNSPIMAGSNVGNAFFGLGALLVSIITAALFKRMSFDRALALVALLPLLPLLFALSGRAFPPGSQTFDVSIAVGLLGNYVTWMAALVLFCYIGLEISRRRGLPVTPLN